jgi:chemotaxis protein MotB
MQHYKRKSGSEGWLTSYADLITNLLIFFVLIITASEIQTGKMEKIIDSLSKGPATQTLSSAAKEVSRMMEEQNLSKDAQVNLTDAGLEIVFDSGVTFASGQAEVLEAMELPLRRVLEVIKPYTQKYFLAIEGHTDEVPISNDRFHSNWELASARALQIRERLESTGIDPKRMRIEAYAENKPLEMGQLPPDADRQTLLAKQRRVVIRLF